MRSPYKGNNGNGVISGPYNGYSVGSNSFPTPPASQAAQAGYRLNGLNKLATQPIRVDSFNQAIQQSIHKAKNKRVLVAILAVAIILFHHQILKEVK